MSSRRRREVAAGGESPNADFICRNSIVCRVIADKPQRTLRVTEFDRVMVLGAQAVSQNECSHTARIQPIGDLFAFVVDGQHAVPAAGTNNYGAVRFVRMRQIDGEIRPVGVFVPERSRRAAGPQ